MKAPVELAELCHMGSPSRLMMPGYALKSPFSADPDFRHPTGR